MSLLLIFTLLVGGLFLFAAELFLPGGVLGVVGGVMLIIGLVGIFLNYGFAVGLLAMLLLLVVAIVLFRMGMTLLPRSRLGKKLLVLTDAHDWISYDNELPQLLGKVGVAHTLLRPSGTAVVEGKRLDVVTKGEFIQPKTTIKIIEVEGNRIVVEKATVEEASDQLPEQIDKV